MRHRQPRFLLRGVSLLFLLLPAFAGCGGGGDSGPLNPISGVLNVPSFVIPAGETRTVTDDIVVNSADDLIIEGTLLVTPGARVALYSDRDVRIHGSVKPALSRTASSRNGDPPADLVIASRNVDITQTSAPFPVEIADPGGSALITTTAANGRVTISQNILTKRGTISESRAENGGNGGDIEVGTQRAVDAAVADGKAGAGIPLSITVTAELRAGNGGSGYTDNRGVQSGKLFDFRGTDGGHGGNVRLSGITVTAENAVLVPGDGGPGGQVNGSKAPSGAAAGEIGSSVKARSGSGGRGGYATVIGQRRAEGRGGKAGDVKVAAGDGGPGGPGGNTTVELGSGGDNVRELDAVVSLVDGGNGGSASVPFQNGGAGGSFVLAVAKRHDGSAGRSAAVVTNNYGRGGHGYNGCRTPPAIGTNGGPGGSYTGPDPLYSPHPNAFVGGNAGDGAPPGVKGSGGTNTRTSEKYEDGRPGVTCDIATLAVQLSHDLRTNGVVRFASGTVIPFRDFQGAHVSPPDTGCDKEHPHAPGGFTINGVGPFDDPDPAGCGIGLFVPAGG